MSEPLLNAARANLGDALIAQIQHALDLGGNTHDIDDVLTGVLNGQFQVFEGERSIVFTEINQYPRLREIRAFVAAGDLDEVFGSIMQRVEAFGRAHGCDRLTATGRHGWARAGKAVGFENPWTAISKNLFEETTR